MKLYCDGVFFSMYIFSFLSVRKRNHNKAKHNHETEKKLAQTTTAGTKQKLHFNETICVDAILCSNVKPFFSWVML
jgi:hypothetical protein